MSIGNRWKRFGNCSGVLAISRREVRKANGLQAIEWSPPTSYEWMATPSLLSRLRSRPPPLHVPTPTNRRCRDARPRVGPIGDEGSRRRRLVICPRRPGHCGQGASAIAASRRDGWSPGAGLIRAGGLSKGARPAHAGAGCVGPLAVDAPRGHPGAEHQHGGSSTPESVRPCGGSQASSPRAPGCTESLDGDMRRIGKPICELCERCCGALC